MPATLTPKLCWSARPGSASSIRSQASFFTSSWKWCRSRRSDEASSADLGHHHLPGQRAVAGGREVPAERSRHRAAAHGIEAVLCLEGRECAADAAEKRLGGWLVEQEPGLTVGD